jgi:hypothetical protein
MKMERLASTTQKENLLALEVALRFVKEKYVVMTVVAVAVVSAKKVYVMHRVLLV